MSHPEFEITSTGNTFIARRPEFIDEDYHGNKFNNPEIKCQIVPAVKYKIIDTVTGEAYQDEGTILFNLNESIKIFAGFSLSTGGLDRYFLEAVNGYEAKEL